MRMRYIWLTVVLIMNGQNAEAVESECQTKLSICKGLWQKLDPKTISPTACGECESKCLAAQKTCQDESQSYFNTANTYLLGCRQACKGVSVP